MRQIKNTLVDIIKQRMAELGLNQPLLSKNSGVSQPVISRLLKGSVNVKINNIDAILNELSLLNATDNDKRFREWENKAVSTLKDIFINGDKETIDRIISAIDEAGRKLELKKVPLMEDVTSPVQKESGTMRKKAA